jgi:predicted glycosyltransferase
MRKALARSPADDCSIVFCATGKSGLGHLRRITNVVTALQKLRPGLGVKLLSNAPLAGLAESERSAFQSFESSDRAAMAGTIALSPGIPVVLDTIVVPGLERIQSPLCLILRETPPEKLKDFILPNGRTWDLVCVPNPADHWLPSCADIGAKRVEATGWIVRKPDTTRPVLSVAGKRRRVLVASGGGGNAETAELFKHTADAIIKRAREEFGADFHAAQALGPRVSENGLLDEAQEYVNAGSHLNTLFAQYDAVISTVGYNSVLELAALDVPVLLVPIGRTFDDQALRARTWASKLGAAHDDGATEDSARWLADTLLAGKRRAPVNLGADGAEVCAKLILELLR